MQPVVERKLCTLLAVIINIGEAEHVCDDFPGWVKAAKFALRVNPGQFESKHRFRRLRAHLTL